MPAASPKPKTVPDLLQQVAGQHAHIDFTNTMVQSERRRSGRSGHQATVRVSIAQEHGMVEMSFTGHAETKKTKAVESAYNCLVETEAGKNLAKMLDEEVVQEAKRARKGGAWEAFCEYWWVSWQTARLISEVIHAIQSTTPKVATTFKWTHSSSHLGSEQRYAKLAKTAGACRLPSWNWRGARKRKRGCLLCSAGYWHVRDLQFALAMCSLLRALSAVFNFAAQAMALTGGGRVMCSECIALPLPLKTLNMFPTPNGAARLSLWGGGGLCLICCLGWKFIVIRLSWQLLTRWRYLPGAMRHLGGSAEARPSAQFFSMAQHGSVQVMWALPLLFATWKSSCSIKQFQSPFFSYRWLNQQPSTAQNDMQKGLHLAKHSLKPFG